MKNLNENPDAILDIDEKEHVLVNDPFTGEPIEFIVDKHEYLLPDSIALTKVDDFYHAFQKFNNAPNNEMPREQWSRMYSEKSSKLTYLRNKNNTKAVMAREEMIEEIKSGSYVISR